jgi:RNA-directed DNA polymerase
MRKRGTSKHYDYTKPSKKAIAHRSTLHRDLDEPILSLNRSLAGWANYFRHGASEAAFSAIDYFVRGRLMRWIRAKYAGRRSARTRSGVGMSVPVLGSASAAYL